MKSESPLTEPIRFKKYANRRLYNLSTSSYMVLGEIEDLIRNGKEIEVIDAKSQEDVTAFILTQIILEKAKDKNTLLPVSLLHLIIRYGDNLLTDFFENYLQQVVNNYIGYKKAMDAQFRNWLDLGKNFSQAAQDSMNPLNLFPSGFQSSEEKKRTDSDK
jgi:polyhydroxyalkanoate synthesis repressor PhaR